MFTIGDFARHGRVSVRMLRHYDAIGLLRPAHVDAASSYRYYRAEQLAQLNRIVALKELGFSLRQVGVILHDRVSAGELRGMLRLRRAELEVVMSEAAARLTEVEARLRSIERENTMPTVDVVVKSLPAMRVAELSGTSESFEPREIGPVVTALYDELCSRLDADGVVPTGAAITRYQDVPGSGAVVVHAGLPVAADVTVEDVRITDLAGVDRAATVVHCGSMDQVLPAVQTLARWLEGNGYRMTAQHARELSLARPEDTDQWVTELQVPITAR